MIQEDARLSFLSSSQNGFPQLSSAPYGMQGGHRSRDRESAGAFEGWWAVEESNLGLDVPGVRCYRYINGPCVPEGGIRTRVMMADHPPDQTGRPRSLWWERRESNPRMRFSSIRFIGDRRSTVELHSLGAGSGIAPETPTTSLLAERQGRDGHSVLFDAGLFC